MERSEKFLGAPPEDLDAKPGLEDPIADRLLQIELYAHR